MMYIPVELCLSLNVNSRAPISAKHSDQTLLCSGESAILNPVEVGALKADYTHAYCTVSFGLLLK